MSGVKISGFIDVLSRRHVRRLLDRTMARGLSSSLVRSIKYGGVAFEEGNAFVLGTTHILPDQTAELTIYSLPSSWGEDYYMDTTILHQLGHVVYNFLLSDKDREEWRSLIAENPTVLGDPEGGEEVFCESYSTWIYDQEGAHHIWGESVTSFFKGLAGNIEAALHSPVIREQVALIIMRAPWLAARIDATLRHPIVAALIAALLAALIVHECYGPGSLASEVSIGTGTVEVRAHLPHPISPSPTVHSPETIGIPAHPLINRLPIPALPGFLQPPCAPDAGH